MKIFQFSIITILSIIFTACNNQDKSEESIEGLTESLNDLSKKIENLNSENSWATPDDNELFNIDIPKHMKDMPELNAEASLTYGYIEQVGDVVKENYLIVITELKDSIATYEELDFEFDALSYSALSVESIIAGLTTYEILSPEPEIQVINGLNCVTTEIEGAMKARDESHVNVFYMMAIFEGENAFYQVLSWTIADQKSEFKEDMKKMIMSFSEK